MDRKQKILIADDNLPFLHLMEVALQQAGFEVVKATDGEQTRKLIDSGANFDLVLMDIVMPKLDGITLVSQLSATITKKLKIVIMTSLYAESVREKVKELPVMDFIEKNDLLPQEMVEKVKGWLRA
jgi:CheY-like chemotaxis protein